MSRTIGKGATEEQVRAAIESAGATVMRLEGSPPEGWRFTISPDDRATLNRVFHELFNAITRDYGVSEAPSSNA